MAIRVLQVVTIMNRGGEETMIMNYYRQMDRTKVQFDFLVHREQRGMYDDEIESLGGRIYRTSPIRPWAYGKYRKWLRNFFKQHNEFAAVHAHILENSGFVLEAARNKGISIRIAHSHLAAVGIDAKYLFRKYGKYVLKHCGATKLLACGEDAGKYLFDGAPFAVLPNAVDTTKFRFDHDLRVRKREELGVTDKLVIGNVARFHPVKNQSYLVEIFKVIHNRVPNSVLLLVGVGEEQENVRTKVKQLQLEESVDFLNIRTDIHELLQAMDVLVFPSKLEGLPLSLIEAQATGLPCILSDRVARETAITDLVWFISLESPPAFWADQVIEASKRVRIDSLDQICAANYDITTNANWLQNFYLQNEQNG